MECLYVGAVYTAAPDHQDYLTPVSNRIRKGLTSPAKIDEYTQKQLAADLAESAEKPFTSLVAGVHIDGKHKSGLFSLTNPPAKRGDVALPLVEWLLSKFPHQFGESLWFNDDVEPETYLFGFGIKALLKQACTECHYLHSRSTTPGNIPVRMWRNVRGVYDPAELLMPTQGEVDRIGYDNLFRYYHINTTWNEIGNNPAALAAVAKHLVEKAQLV